MPVRLYSNVNDKYRSLGTAGITSMSQVVWGPSKETFFEADTRRRKEIAEREKLQAEDAAKIRRVQEVQVENGKRRKSKKKLQPVPRDVLKLTKKLSLKTKLKRKTKK